VGAGARLQRRPRRIGRGLAGALHLAELELELDDDVERVVGRAVRLHAVRQVGLAVDDVEVGPAQRVRVDEAPRLREARRVVVPDLRAHASRGDRDVHRHVPALLMHVVDADVRELGLELLRDEAGPAQAEVVELTAAHAEGQREQRPLAQAVAVLLEGGGVVGRPMCARLNTQLVFDGTRRTNAPLWSSCKLRCALSATCDHSGGKCVSGETASGSSASASSRRSSARCRWRRRASCTGGCRCQLRLRARASPRPRRPSLWRCCGGR
jgi:hypothetical protein